MTVETEGLYLLVGLDAICTSTTQMCHDKPVTVAWSYYSMPLLPTRLFGDLSRPNKLSLYRSLLRVATRFETESSRLFLVNVIRERFRFHQHETSLRSAIRCLAEGKKALHLLREAQCGNTAYQKRIESMSLGQSGPLYRVIQKLKKIPDDTTRALVASDIRPRSSQQRCPRRRVALPESLTEKALINIPIPTTRLNRETYTKTVRQQKRRRRTTKRKPYQVVITTRNSTGYVFKRIKGWKQSIQTTMMLKNKVKKYQQRLNEYDKLVSYVDMLKHESHFLTSLGVTDDTRVYDSRLRKAMALNSQRRAHGRFATTPSNDSLSPP